MGGPYGQPCGRESIDACIDEIATHKEFTGFDSFGKLAKSCFTNYKDSDCGGSDQFPPDECFMETLPKAMECIIENNLYGDCLIEHSNKFLECSMKNKRHCNFVAGSKQCQNAKYWDPEGYESLEAIASRTSNVELCPTVDGTWIKPICGMTNDCCGNCMDEIEPLLTCMIDEVFIPNSPDINGGDGDDNENSVLNCYDDGDNTMGTSSYSAVLKKDNVCDFDEIHSGNGNRQLQELEQQLLRQGVEPRKLHLDNGPPLLNNKNITSTTLEHCERKLALNFALSLPGMAVNEYMVCLLEVAAARTYKGEKVNGGDNAISDVLGGDGTVTKKAKSAESRAAHNFLFWFIGFACGIVAGIIGLMSYQKNKGIYGKVNVNDEQPEEGEFLGGRPATVGRGKTSLSMADRSLQNLNRAKNAYADASPEYWTGS